MQAIHSTRPGGHVGFVGVSHDVAIPGDELFMAGVHIHGGPARPAVPALTGPAHLGPHDRPRQGLRPHPPAGRGGEGYRAMDQRTATKVLLTLRHPRNRSAMPSIPVSRTFLAIALSTLVGLAGAGCADTETDTGRPPTGASSTGAPSTTSPTDPHSPTPSSRARRTIT